MDKLAEIWREWCQDDVENGTALQWRTVEEQIEVQRVTRPKLAELPWHRWAAIEAASVLLSM